MEGMGELYVLMVTEWFCRRDARRVRLVRERALPFLHSAPVIQHFRASTIIIPCVRVEEGELLEMDGHVGGRARCEAEVVGDSVAEVGRRGLCGVCVSGEGTGAISSATDREPSEEWFEEEGEWEGAEGVSM
jgi:hypothetical protein